MDMGTQILVAVVLAIVLSLVAAALVRGKSITLRKFFWGDQNFTSGDLAHLILSTSFSINGMLYQTWLGYSIGWAALWTQVVWCCGYVWMAKYSSKIGELSGSGTLHGVLGNVFGRRAGVWGAYGSVIGFLTLIGWEIACAKGIATMILPKSGSAINLFAVLLAVVAATYTVRGGIKGSLGANRIQNFFAGSMLILGVSYFGFWAMKEGGSAPLNSPGLLESHSRLLTTLGIGGLITNFVFSLGWQFVDMSNWQSIAASSKEKGTARRGLLLGTGWVFIFPGVIGTAAGVFLSGVPGLTSDDIVPVFLSKLGGVSPLLGILMIAAFVSAMLATLDGYFLAASQAIIWDIKENARVNSLLAIEDKEKSEIQLVSESQILGRAKGVVVLLAVVGSGGMLFLQWAANLNVFNLVYVATIGQLSLLPAVLAALTNKSRLNGLASIVCALVIGATCIIVGAVTGKSQFLDWSGTITVVAGFFGLFVPSHANRSRNP